jgi:osmotically-inducible protein OsmY
MDSDLEQSVRGCLAKDPRSALGDISIVATNGRVHLCGEATSYAEKRRAADLVAGIDGVRQVINQLRVTPC